jgi:two-component system, chemotaxis family, protein-glutamate methylesterase/glutaminase
MKKMKGHDIIAIGASAGGVEALMELAGQLPADLPASVFVALHVPSHGASILPRILSRSGPLPASHAVDGEPIRPGRIYVAPPDHHLLIHEDKVRLSRGPRENGVRPAVDPLFRSAARWYGPRVVGVVLSGTLDDGTAGILAIKERGGVAMVQDPADALFPGMPRSAIEAVAVDHVAPASAIPTLLDRLARDAPDAEGSSPRPVDIDEESAIAEFNLEAIRRDERPGTPSGFACPDCAGVLWEIRDGEMIRYRCRVGHAYSPESLLSKQSLGLETALWTALRALEERAAIAARMAQQFRDRGQVRSADRFVAQARDSRAKTALIRQLLMKEEPPAEPTEADGPAAGEGGPG